MEINQEGLELIKRFEGCRLETYLDCVGVPTIGYGHIKDVQIGQTITQEQAEEFLKEDLGTVEQGIPNLVRVSLTGNQFSALFSFCFNLGLHALAESTLLKKLNEGDIQGAAEEFQKWDHAGRKANSGLLRRRLAERDLFLKVE